MREISLNNSMELEKVVEFLKKHNIDYEAKNELNSDPEVIVKLMPLVQEKIDLIIDFLGDSCDKDCKSKLDYYDCLVFWEAKINDENNSVKNRILDFIEGNASMVNNYYFMAWDTSVYNEVSKECGGAADRVSDLFSSLDTSINLFFEAFGSKLKDRILEEFEVTDSINDKNSASYIMSNDRQRLAIGTLEKIIYVNKKTN